MTPRRFLRSSPALWTALVLLAPILVHCGQREFDDDGGSDAGSGGEGGADGGTDGVDGTGGSVEGRELTWSDDALPSGFYNLDYRAALEIDGARGALTFEITAGELPLGLALSEEGVLSGRPREEGEFPITIRVRDAEGATLDVETTLVIGRKRWLAFVAEVSAADTRQELRLADISKSVPEVIAVSKGLKAFTDIPATAFSPDGRRLAYLADKFVDGERSLYWVDLATDAPKGDQLLSGTGKITAFAWSPSSRYLAYFDDTEKKIFVLDFQGDLSVPIDVGASTGAPSWIGDTIVFSTTTGVGYSKIEDGASSTPREVVSTYRVVHTVSPDGKLVALKGSVGMTYCGEYSSVWNRETDDVTTMPERPTRYSSDLKYVVSLGSAIMDLVTVDDPTAEPIAHLTNAGTCEGIWSPDSKWFATENADDKLVVLSSAGEANQVLAPASSTLVSWDWGGGPPTGNRYAGFSADGRWFRYKAGNAVYLAGVSEEGFTNPEALSAGPVGVTSWFSPNSEILVLWETITGGGTALRFFDVSGAEATDDRVLDSGTGNRSIAVGGNSSDPSPNLSFDSSAFIYQVQEDTNGASDLYVIDLLDEDAEGRKLTSLVCPPSNACRALKTAVFQP